MTKTKHFVSAWGAACLALGFMAHPLSAATFDGFNYEDGVTITITGYTPQPSTARELKKSARRRSI
jgi:hypothetical protein